MFGFRSARILRSESGRSIATKGEVSWSLLTIPKASGATNVLDLGSPRSVDTLIEKKGSLTRNGVLAMLFKLGMSAQQHWEKTARIRMPGDGNQPREVPWWNRSALGSANFIASGAQRASPFDLLLVLSLIT